MSFLNQYFSEIICINLEKRNDRWIESEKEFKNHNLNVKRLLACDGTNLPKNNQLTLGQLGALYSHLSLIRHAKSKNLDNILILEDDVEFQSDLNTLFKEFIKEVPNDWNILYFGANHSENNIWMNEPLIKVSTHVYKVIRSYSMHCYAVNNTAYDKVIKVLSQQNKPCDVLISEIQPELNCYVFRPHLAWQRPGYSDIEGCFTNYSFLKN